MSGCPKGAPAWQAHMMRFRRAMTEASTDPPKTLSADGPPKPAEAKPSSHRWRKLLLWVGAVAGLAIGGYLLMPAVETALNTVSTDDAYVNGHVTLVAPRVSGQVSRVLVDDNDRVKKGALLVQLDKEPFEDQVAVKKAAVAAAEADLVAAEAQTRGLLAQIQSDRFQLESAIEDVHTQIANLRANIATLKSRQATLELARNNLRRGEELLPSGGISKEELDQRRQTVKVDEAAVDQALEAVLAIASRPGPPRPASQGPRPGRGPRRPRPELLGDSAGAGTMLPQRRPARVRSPVVGVDPEASPRRLLEARPSRQSRSHLCQPDSPGTRHQAGRVQAPPGPPRPRAGRARPPLLRRRQRDRWRGDQPQRQPRQQCRPRGRA